MPTRNRALGLSKDVAGSQESAGSSSSSGSGSNLATSASAPGLASSLHTSPSANKRLRLAPYSTTGATTSSHCRYASASSGSSCFPSPYLGSGSVNVDGPNGYRKNVKAKDLLIFGGAAPAEEV